MRKPTIEIWKGGTFLLYDAIEGDLYNNDGTPYKTQPKPAAKAPMVKQKPKSQPKPQMSIFDLAGEDLDKPIFSTKSKDDENMPSTEDIQEAVTELQKEEKKKTAMSPMYQKYLDIQDKYPECFVFMRLGDFYEVFGENAKVLANELGLTLTGRDCGLESRVPMIGFPYHASDVYFNKILSNGHKIAVVETNGNIRSLPDNIDIDMETGEIYDEMSKEEMREFDGDIDECIPQPHKEKDNFDECVAAFDKSALYKLVGILGDELELR